MNSDMKRYRQPIATSHHGGGATNQRRRKRQKSARAGGSDASAHAGALAGPIPLPTRGDLVECLWTVENSTNTPASLLDNIAGDSQADGLKVWWPAVVVRVPTHGADADGHYEIIYTASHQAHDASELDIWRRVSPDADNAPDATTEPVNFSGNTAYHINSKSCVAWRFATWRDTVTRGGTPEYGSSAVVRCRGAPSCEAVAKAQTSLKEELDALRELVRQALGPAAPLNLAASKIDFARRTLRVFLRAAMADAMKTATPKSFADDSVVLASSLSTKRVDCTLGEFGELFQTILMDIPAGGRDRVHGYPSDHSLHYPSPRHAAQSEHAYSIKFDCYADLCAVAGIPVERRALSAGRGKLRDACAVVGTVVTAIGEGPACRESGSGSVDPSQGRFLLVGQSCRGLFRGSRDRSQSETNGKDASWDVVALIQEHTGFHPSDSRSDSEFVARKMSTAVLATLSRAEPSPSAASPDPVSLEASRLPASEGDGFEDVAEGAPTAAADGEDQTFDLCWKPASVPGGSVFHAGEVPGSLIARIPVVLVRTGQLIESILEELLYEDGSHTGKDSARAALRLHSVSPPRGAQRIS